MPAECVTIVTGLVLPSEATRTGYEAPVSAERATHREVHIHQRREA
jgi:hypothetical protein